MSLVSLPQRSEKLWDRFVFIVVLILVIVITWAWFSTNQFPEFCINDGLDGECFPK